MPRGDELREEYRFSDRDDDVDDLGYGGGGGGGGSYDGDDEEDGGWMTHKDDSDDLWDSTDDVDEEDDESGSATTFEAGDDDDEEEDTFGSAPTRGRPGRPAGSSNKAKVNSAAAPAAAKPEAAKKAAPAPAPAAAPTPVAKPSSSAWLTRSGASRRPATGSRATGTSIGISRSRTSPPRGSLSGRLARCSVRCLGPSRKHC